MRLTQSQSYTSWTAALLAAVLLIGTTLTVSAQDTRDASPIMILNQEGLISQSLYGMRIAEEVEAATAALASENRRIEAQLSAEELGLTERRDTLAAAEFRVLADEFDVRVEGIRAAQLAKAQDIQMQAEAAQARFFELSFPLLLDIVRQRGAQVLLDSRTVLISASGIDITDDAIAQINAELGDGGQEPLVFLPGLSDAPPSPLGEDGAMGQEGRGDAPNLPVLDLETPPVDE